MANIKIPVGRLWHGDQAGFDAINYARNGVSASADVGTYLAANMNLLLGGRLKSLFSKSIPVSKAINSAADVSLWRFACHTSPLATRVRAIHVCLPNGSARVAANNSELYWVTETALTGAGTSTTMTKVQVMANGASTAPSNYVTVISEFAVSPDTDYRMTLHAVNGVRVISCAVFEIPRGSVDPDTETAAIDPRPMSIGAPIFDAQLTDLNAAASAIWRRQQAHLFRWCCDDGTTFASRTSATYANLFEQSVTAYAAYNAATTAPGGIVFPEYRNSHDSTNVGVTFYVLAKVSSAATGNVRFIGTNGTLTTVSVTATTATWYTATANLLGTDAVDKIDVHIKGDGANSVQVYAVGAFIHFT